MEFMFAFSGIQALNYLEEHNHEAVLILSDINMPGMTGLQLLRRIKETYESPSPRLVDGSLCWGNKKYTGNLSTGA